ncbi:ABC transporter permease [Pseudomonas typographi]|uniref:ABC transporter permease n=1 Tax=Pseudomonas typographi TaxID=2715964 RepID=UPI0016840DB3|nr:FtsX-like permease family protein [Pseudomonas typographi]MBD1588501.1 ABC transporter permease [Pseudomonas typographi]
MNGLPLLRLCSLALRQMVRDARAGELRVLFFALVIAVACSSAIGYFGARLNAAMALRASEFLAADLVLQGTTEARPEQLRQGQALGLAHAKTVEFTSVAATDASIQLSSIKAVEAPYPLRGQLKSSAEPYGAEQAGGLPGAGEAWVEPRLLAALNVKVGGNLDIGTKTLRISRVLTYEPDRAADFYSLTPRVLMNLADLAATGILQPGSRVSFRDLWRGAPALIAQYREQVQGSLAPNQRLLDSHDGNRQVGGALGKAESYLNLASLVAVMLAGVAVALSANRYAARRFDTSALLRCLGLSRLDTLLLFSLQLTLVGLAASLAGALMGWLSQFALFALLHGLLPASIPSAGPAPALAGVGTGLAALAGFALPPLMALGRVPPLRVLRRDLLPAPTASWAVYGTAVLAVGLIMWRLSLDLRLTLALLAGGVVAALVLGALLVGVLRRLRGALANAPLPWRLGLGQLLRHPTAAAGQALAFGLILFAMALVVLLRTELLDTWQQQLPKEAPNYFAVNILPGERDAFAQQLGADGARASPLYPVVPGRLTHIDGQPVADRVSAGSRGERATQRDLSLTWAAELPAGNQITAGQWWQPTIAGELPGVSVEGELAQSLGLTIGSTLTFNVGGVVRDARVTSLRSIHWDNFQPNFFIIFQPGTLQDLPATYLGSFYLAPGNDARIVALSRAFPATTLLQVDAVLAQLRSILAQVTLAVQFVLLFVLAAGVAVLFAGLQATLDERIRQGALLRALGAARPLLVSARRIEFAVLGAASGGVAALATEAASWALYRFALQLPWAPHPWLLLLPLAGAALVGLAGMLGTHRALAASPLAVLREA